MIQLAEQERVIVLYDSYSTGRYGCATCRLTRPAELVIGNNWPLYLGAQMLYRYQSDTIKQETAKHGKDAHWYTTYFCTTSSAEYSVRIRMNRSPAGLRREGGRNAEI